MNKLPLSVAVITKNEEERLPECLASVSFASDLVVVDSGSSDRTVEIARAADARVYDLEWRGFGPQKQFAIEQCREGWVLVLDADERILPETEQEGAVRAAEKVQYGIQDAIDDMKCEIPFTMVFCVCEYDPEYSLDEIANKAVNVFDEISMSDEKISRVISL